MNPSQYVPPGPSTYYVPSPYPQAYAVSPYPAAPGFARPIGYPSPAFTHMPGAAGLAGFSSPPPIPDRPSSQQQQQQQQQQRQREHQHQQLAAAPHTWPQPFSFLPGQVEDVVSAAGGPLPSQAHVDARPSWLSMPQVQDVFALPGGPRNGAHGIAVATTMPMPGFMSPPQGMRISSPGLGSGGGGGGGDGGSYAMPAGLGLPSMDSMAALPRGLDSSMMMRPPPMGMDSTLAGTNSMPFPANFARFAMSPPQRPPPASITGYPPTMSP